MCTVPGALPWIRVPVPTQGCSPSQAAPECPSVLPPLLTQPRAASQTPKGVFRCDTSLSPFLGGKMALKVLFWSRSGPGCSQEQFRGECDIVTQEKSWERREGNQDWEQTNSSKTPELCSFKDASSVL